MKKLFCYDLLLSSSATKMKQNSILSLARRRLIKMTIASVNPTVVMKSVNVPNYYVSRFFEISLNKIHCALAAAYERRSDQPLFKFLGFVQFLNFHFYQLMEYKLKESNILFGIITTCNWS